MQINDLNDLLRKRDRDMKRTRSQLKSITTMPKEGLSIKQLAAQAALAAGLQQQVAALSSDNETLRRASQQRNCAGLGERAGRQLQELASAFAVREESDSESESDLTPRVKSRSSTPSRSFSGSSNNASLISPPASAVNSNGVNSRHAARVSAMDRDSKVPRSSRTTAPPPRASVLPEPLPGVSLHLFPTASAATKCSTQVPPPPQPGVRTEFLSSARARSARSTRIGPPPPPPSTVVPTHHGVIARRPVSVVATR